MRGGLSRGSFRVFPLGLHYWARVQDFALEILSRWPDLAPLAWLLLSLIPVS